MTQRGGILSRMRILVLLRCSAIWVLLGVIGSLGPIHGSEDGREPKKSMVLVKPNGDARLVESLDAIEATNIGESSKLWVWCKTAPPQRLELSEVNKWQCSAEENRITVRLMPENDDIPTAGHIVGAPQRMWGEVPEGLLPRWSVEKSAEIEIPVSGDVPSKLRFIGAKAGSRWVTIDPNSSTTTVRVEPSLARTLLLTSNEGSRIPGYLTLLSGNRAEDFKAIYRSDEKGVLTLPALPLKGELTGVAAAQGFVPTHFRVSANRFPRFLRLEPGCELTGRVVDMNDRPIQGAKVAAEALVDTESLSIVRREDESDEEGYWNLGAVPRKRIVLALERKGFARKRFRKDLTNCSDREEISDLTLEPGTNLPLRVVDDRDEPIPEAKVSTAAGVRETTDKEGRATLKEVSAAQPISLAIKAKGHVEREIVVQSPFPKETTVRVERSVQVRGRLVHPSRTPVRGATVRVQEGRRFDDQEISADGEFKLFLDPGREVELRFRSPTTTETSISVQARFPGQEIDVGEVVASSGLTITGRVSHAYTGEPIARARVWAPRVGEGGAILSWALGDVLETTTTSSGEFELTGFPRQPGWVRIEANGLARTEVEVLPEPQLTVVDLGDLFLQPGASVRVTGDKEILGTVRVAPNHSTNEMDMLTAPFHDGKAVVEDVPPGPATVSLVAEDRWVCEKRIDVPDEEVLLEVPCDDQRTIVQGIVTVGGRVSGRGELRWSQEAGGDTVIMNRDTRSGLRQQTTLGVGRGEVIVDVDADGAFKTDRLAPGRWAVTWQPSSGAWSQPRFVDLTDERVQNVPLAFSEHAVRGIVRDENGAAVPMARVTTQQGSSLALTASDGSFELLDLSPGVVQVQARKGDRRSTPITVDLSSNRKPDPVILVLEDDADNPIGITVYSQGLPAAGAMVFAELANRGYRILTTDGKGRADLKLLPPVPTQIRIAAVAGGEWVLTEWMEVDQARGGVVLEIGPTGSLHIVSNEVTGPVKIHSASGWDLTNLFRTLGVPPKVSPSHPLTLRGLPENSYSVSAGTYTATISIDEGKTSQLKIE